MDKEHDHIGPWWGIGVAIFLTVALAYAALSWHDYRIDRAMSRIVELEQRIECAAPQELFTDIDGNEVCLEPAD